MGHSYGSKTAGSDTTTERLPEVEYLNGIHGESPNASLIPEIQPLPEAAPKPPTDDAT